MLEVILFEFFLIIFIRLTNNFNYEILFTLFYGFSHFNCLLPITSNSILVGANKLATTTNVYNPFSQIAIRTHSDIIFCGNLTNSHLNGSKKTLKYAWTLRPIKRLIKFDLIIKSFAIK